MASDESFDQARDPLLGTAYRTRAVLGRGAMGLVVEAEHIALRTTVVVKLLHAELARQPDFVDRMRIEAQAMSRLRSPHLTRCTDLSSTRDGRPFLVMERLYGRTVAEEIAARGALPVAEAVDIARQTLAGLAVVHRAGMVHRDIKPANLFLAQSDDGRRLLKILDFGIAKVIAAGDGAPRPLTFPTAEGTAVGSPRCFSPEQARGLPVDARTDIYAVGVLLYTLLTGKGPFHEIRGVLDIMRAHVVLVPAPPSMRVPEPIPEELDAIVMRALAKRPEDRFASAEELSAALAGLTLAAAEHAEPHPVARFDTEPLPHDEPVDEDARTLVCSAGTASPRRFDTEVMPRAAAPPAPRAPSIPSPWCSAALQRDDGARSSRAPVSWRRAASSIAALLLVGVLAAALLARGRGLL